MKTLITSILLFMATGLSAQKPVELPLWPNGAPNDNGLKGEEVMSAPYRLTNVTQPTITVYRPATPNGMTIIMCPGGAYALLAMDHEGHDMAPWFNSLGITYVVLKYRMPNGHCEVPLSDAEQAIRIVRKHAKDWNIRTDRVGIMGASALSIVTKWIVPLSLNMHWQWPSARSKETKCRKAISPAICNASAIVTEK